MKINQFFDYLILAISVLYSTYIVNDYLIQQFNEIILSLPFAVILTTSAHFYLVSGINKLRIDKNLNRKFVAGVMLSSFVIFIEFNSMINVVSTSIVDYTQLNELKSQLSENRKRANNLGVSKHYAKVEMRRQIAIDNKVLVDQIESETKIIDEQKKLAGVRANQFKVISVILLILVCLTMNFEQELEQGFIQEKSRIKQEKTKIFSEDDEQNLTENNKRTYDHLTSQERILLASNYIKLNPKCSQQAISKIFKLNISQVSQARKLLNFDNNRPQKIGF